MIREDDVVLIVDLDLAAQIVCVAVLRLLARADGHGHAGGRRRDGHGNWNLGECRLGCIGHASVDKRGGPRATMSR